MKFGLHAHGLMKTDASQASNFDKLLDYTELARRSQFDLIWVGHHFLLEKRHKFQPIPTIARLAAGAPDLHVAVNILLSLHSPIVIAEQLATIDALPGGKAILSPIQGYREKEFDAIGIPRSHRATRLTKGVEAIEKLSRKPRRLRWRLFQLFRRDYLS